MDEPYYPPRHTWARKFATALRGWWLGTRGHNSFVVHLPVAAMVLAAAYFLQATWTEVCLLLLCITLVLAAELFNSALESLAKAITQTENPHIGQALDIASGAVLFAAVGSGVVGLVIFIPRLMTLLQ
jgi:diacylglycerol kinase